MTRPFTALHRLSRALLSRGASRVGGTDWWTVFIELAVVVFGILIAFQLDNWGKRWQARQDERALLQRIWVEAASDRSNLEVVRDQHIESADNYRRLAKAAGTPPGRRTLDVGGRDSCNLLRLPAVRRHAGGAISLAAGERGDLVTDAVLRDALRKAQAERAFNESQLTYFRDNFLRYSDRIEPHMIWRFGGQGQAVCAVDINGLRRDAAARAVLPKLYRDQRRFAIYRQLEVQATEAVISRVACLRQGNCQS